MITVFCRMSEFLDREAGAEDNARWDSDDDFEPPATPAGGWETVAQAGGAEQAAATEGGNAGRGVGRGGGFQNAEEDGNGRGRGRGRGQVRVGWLPIYLKLSVFIIVIIIITTIITIIITIINRGCRNVLGEGRGCWWRSCSWKEG